MTTQPAPCCDHQRMTNVNQKQWQVMSTATTSSSPGLITESLTGGATCDPSVKVSGDECRRLASPLIAVLLASVSGRRDSDDAQSILEDHLLRVWDETVSTGFSPDLLAGNSVNSAADKSKWTSNDAAMTLCPTYGYQRRYLQDNTVAPVEQPVSPPINQTRYQTTNRFSPPPTEVAKRRCVVADLPIQRTSLGFKTNTRGSPLVGHPASLPGSCWPRNFGDEQLFSSCTCRCCVDSSSRVYEIGEGRRPSTVCVTNKGSCPRCGHQAAAMPTTRQKITADDRSPVNASLPSAIRSRNGSSAVTVAVSGATTRRPTPPSKERQTETGHHQDVIALHMNSSNTTSRLRTASSGGDVTSAEVTDLVNSNRQCDVDMTTVAYYLCDEPIPYRTTLNSRHPTLGQFKQLVTKRGQWRYFFRKASDEFDSGVVLEEVTDDGTLLPLWDGKVVGKLERVQ